MWVRAQVDYLQRLPNDVEKRKALKQLPPDLPQTYIRILEAIESSFPVRTATYIRRVLRWLTFRDELADLGPEQMYDLTSDALCQAVCVESEHEWPPVGAVPTKQQILRWCGCLVRETGGILRLSHFTVNEFLGLDTASISVHRVRKYLRDPGGEECIISCLRYMTHENFRHSALFLHNDHEVGEFLKENPLYTYLIKNLHNVFDRTTCCGIRE